MRAIVLSLLIALSALPMAAQNGKGFLRTKIDPWVAGVFVDGAYKGTAVMFGSRERMIELGAGTHDVELVDPRYERTKVQVKIEAGKTTTIRHTMSPLDHKPKGPLGELVTEGFGNSAVYLNGAYYANTSEIGNEGHALLLAPGTYSLRIAPVDGGADREEKIVINTDETLVLSKDGAPVRRR